MFGEISLNLVQNILRASDVLDLRGEILKLFRLLFNRFLLLWSLLLWWRRLLWINIRLFLLVIVLIGLIIVLLIQVRLLRMRLLNKMLSVWLSSFRIKNLIIFRDLLNYFIHLIYGNIGKVPFGI